MPGTADSPVRNWVYFVLKALTLFPNARETTLVDGKDVQLTGYSLRLSSGTYGGELETQPVKVTGGDPFSVETLRSKKISVCSETLSVHAMSENGTPQKVHSHFVRLPLTLSAEKQTHRVYSGGLSFQGFVPGEAKSTPVSVSLTPPDSKRVGLKFLKEALTCHGESSCFIKPGNVVANPFPVKAFSKLKTRSIACTYASPKIRVSPEVLNSQPLIKRPLPLQWLPFSMKAHFRQKLAEKIHCLPENILLQFVYDRLVPIYYSSVQLSDSGELFCMLKPNYQLKKHPRQENLNVLNEQIPPFTQFLAIGIESKTNTPVQTLIPDRFRS
jgi:hypothetical protein